ncbi:MAG: alpha/beta fold hydrolase [Chromatiales bacterium]|nr:alpha/beta fold hydrolase [Chromatiales bacterium]
MKRLVETEISITGPAGSLEALVSDAAAARAVAVICHPHPQHGGTMHNKVAHTLARTFAALGLATIRFNFRGVGASAGSYADGLGEVDDAVAVLDFAQQRWPGAALWLGGFSFGGMIAIAAAARRPVERLVCVAPPIYRLDVAILAQPKCQWLILIGDEDELVDVDAVIAWVNELEPGPQLIVLEGVDHFFHGRLTQLKDSLIAWTDEEKQT